MTVLIAIASAATGFAIGATMFYSLGKDDGYAEAAEWYSRARRKQ